MSHTLQSVCICLVVGQHSEKDGKALTPIGKDLSGLWYTVWAFISLQYGTIKNYLDKCVVHLKALESQHCQIMF